MAIHFTIERSGDAFFAKADGGPRFFIGNQTKYTDKTTGETFEGLYNVPTRALPKLIYKADDFRQIYGFWSDFIEPTSRCEGGNFLTLNTYDRARFTWGFGQFAAHVPDGDFVLFFRDLLQRPESADYFPDLAVKDGRIARIKNGRYIPLESASGTGPLLDYLNPTTQSVEDAEVIAAAKLMHWTTSHVEARELQVLHMIGAFRRLMEETDRRLDLDGRTADICCVICDIRHQGRAKYSAIQGALNAANPLKSLLKLGEIAYPDRIKTLRREVENHSAVFTAETWNRAADDFKSLPHAVA